VAYGNEGSPEVVEAFSRRFGVDVIDAYGATEGGVAVDRDAEERAGALGKVGPNIKIVDEEGNEKPGARFDEQGRLLNAADCVGEMVNTAGGGPFEGYYNNPEANEKTLRFGWYWTGDLGYLDDDGYLYFAGRNADWLRVDGENFPAAPIESALARHPDVVHAAVYGVPDDQAGDQVMAGLVLRDDAELDLRGFAAWLDVKSELSPKWRPRYLRVLREPPTTGTNKIVKRVLVQAKWRSDLVAGDPVYRRLRGESQYRRFTERDEAELHDSFVRYRRERFWDL
jgi:fatty-acyl-CoA synthase